MKIGRIMMVALLSSSLCFAGTADEKKPGSNNGGNQLQPSNPTQPHQPGGGTNPKPPNPNPHPNPPPNPNPHPTPLPPPQPNPQVMYQKGYDDGLKNGR
ncbi:MAG: hypothetical protein PHQ23_10705, partial [Candidatus Wallbacteria bacterium]|nr:hypothetical protein [Candidatus Wallbacteria bacterium]